MNVTPHRWRGTGSAHGLGHNENLKLTGMVVLMSFLFGNNFVALEVGLRHAGPITLQAVAVTFAVAALVGLSRRERLPVMAMQRDTMFAIAAIGLALSVASPLLMAYGVQRVNPAVAAMVVASAPISTLLLEWVVLHDRLSGLSIVGVVVGVIGVGLVVSPLGGDGASELVGVIMLIGASTAWAVGLILTRVLPGVVGGGRFVIWQMAFGLPVLYTLAFVLEGATIEWSWPFVIAAGYSGIFAKGTASFLQFRTVRLSSPLHSSLSAFIVPVVGTASAFVLLGQTVAPIQLVGALVISIAVGIVIGGHRKFA